MRFFIIGIIFWVLTAGCENKTQPKDIEPFQTFKPEYARHFLWEEHNGFTILKILSPYPGGKPRTYILLPQDADVRMLPDSLRNFEVIRTPVEKIIATSVTHLEPLYALGEGDKLIGFAQASYIVNPWFKKRVEEGKIEEVGNGLMMNTEKVMMLRPDVILGFSSQGESADQRNFSKHKIPYLYVAEWLETHPLGRAEWIKVFGLLTHREKKADSIFSEIKKKYEAIKHKASQNRGKKPMVFQGGIFQDKFYVPGGQSWAAQLIHDAGGKYVLSTDKNTESKVLSYEQALAYLNRSDIWLNPGSFETKEQLVKAFPALAHSKIGKEGEIWNLYTEHFFEKSVLHPEYVLEDLYHIFKNDNIRQYHFARPVK